MSSVANALAENDFYTIPGKDEAPDATWEKFYDRAVESPGAEGIRRIVDQRRAPTFPKPRAMVARFVAFQYLRGPSSRFATVEQYKKLVEKTAKTLTPAMYKKYLREMMGEDASDKEARELYEFAQDDTKYKIGVSSESLLHAQLALEASLPVMRRLLARRWDVVNFDEPVLITGDEPVVLMNETGDPGEAFGISLAPIVAFPTDPWHALLMFREPRGLRGFREGTDELAMRINRHVAFSCHRFIVQRPGRDLVRSLDLPEKATPTEMIGPYVMYRRNLSNRGAALLRDQMLGPSKTKR